MEVRVVESDTNGLERILNSIRYENVLNILSEHSYDGTLWVIV